MENANQKKCVPVLLITGLSGAGRSSVLNILEDLGYTTIDNLPMHLASQVVCKQEADAAPLALSIDMRSQGFTSKGLLALMQDVKESGQSCALVFLDSDNTIIGRRYLETRRVHPLGHALSLQDLVEKERKLLKPLRKQADHVIDTSLLTPLELKGLVRQLFSFSHQRALTIDVVSFAFKKGVPREANFVFDMRFLKNPFYEEALKQLTGQDARVRDYVAQLPLFQLFKNNLQTMLKSLVKAVELEGRGLFVIAFGCSGGQHRSVVMAEECCAWLLKEGFKARLSHRELQ